MARRKVTRESAVFALKELDRVHAAAKALGLEPPALSEFGDAMTPTAARAWLAWGAKQPQIVRALQSAQSADYRMAEHVRDVLHHFSFAHPQTPTGPQPWAEPISPALAAFATGTRPTFDLAELHPNEADALRNYAALRCAPISPLRSPTMPTPRQWRCARRLTLRRPAPPRRLPQRRRPNRRTGRQQPRRRGSQRRGKRSMRSLPIRSSWRVT